MKKTLRKIHLWLSIPFGLVISVICLSGAALVFEDEITELCRRELYFVKNVSNTTIPVGQLAQKVALTLPDSVSVTGITTSADPRRAYLVNLSKPRRASVAIDQYTGEIKGISQRSAFFTFMFKTHRWLLDSATPGSTLFLGKTVVGISTLIFTVILISGIIIWIPRTYKALKNRLKINTGKGKHRLWFDLHSVGGLYASILLLAMALTGLTWSFPWYRTAFYKTFGVETQQTTKIVTHTQAGNTARHEQKTHSRTQEHSPQKPENPFAHWQQTLGQLKTQNPGYSRITLSRDKASITFSNLGNRRASDNYTLDPATGNITGHTPYTQQDRSANIRGWIYSVHVGSWGGTATRILSFLAALLGGILPLTGYYLWIRKQKKKTKN